MITGHNVRVFITLSQENKVLIGKFGFATGKGYYFRFEDNGHYLRIDGSRRLFEYIGIEDCYFKDLDEFVNAAKLYEDSFKTRSLTFTDIRRLLCYFPTSDPLYSKIAGLLNG